MICLSSSARLVKDFILPLYLSPTASSIIQVVNKYPRKANWQKISKYSSNHYVMSAHVGFMTYADYSSLSAYNKTHI